MRYMLAAVILAMGIGLGSGYASAEMDDYSSGYDSYRDYNNYGSSFGGFSGPSGTFQSPDTFSQQQYNATSQITTAAGGGSTMQHQLVNMGTSIGSALMTASQVPPPSAGMAAPSLGMQLHDAVTDSVSGFVPPRGVPDLEAPSLGSRIHEAVRAAVGTGSQPDVARVVPVQPVHPWDHPEDNLDPSNPHGRLHKDLNENSDKNLAWFGGIPVRPGNPETRAAYDRSIQRGNVYHEDWHKMSDGAANLNSRQQSINQIRATNNELRRR